MAWFPCPICSTKNPRGAMRCSSCGAAFDDPDVRALGGQAAAVTPESLGEAGSLSASRFLRFSLEGLVDGSSVARLALVGAALLAVGFLLPLTMDFETLVPAWKAVNRRGPDMALVYPIGAVFFGLVFGLAPLKVRISRVPVSGGARATALAALGVAGLATLPSLGRFAGANEAPLTLVPLLLMPAAAAIILRLHQPRDRPPRITLIAAGALAMAALFIPFADAWRVLPTELRFYLEGPEQLATGSTAGAFLEVWNRDPNVLFVCAFALLPLAMVPAAILVAWPTPSGIWDKAGLVLRPIGWLVLLYLPFSYALQAFNLTGWDVAGVVGTGEHVVRYEDFVKTTMVGRVRLAFLAGGFSLWAGLGLVPLLARVTGRSGRTG